jgi:uncharacterized protein (TIGR00369 family)
MLRYWAAGEFAPPPHAAAAGLVITAAPEPGVLEMRWEPPAHLANPAGIVHGGYISLVCDDAAGLAAASFGERFRPPVTLDLHVSFLRPAHIGERYTVRGTVAHRGSQRVLADASILDGQQRLIARAQATFALRDMSIAVPPASVIDRFHHVVNRGDADAAAKLVTDDVEVGGPRGSARGVAALRGWVEHAGIQLTAGRTYRRGDVVVVAQTARWSGDGTTHAIATAFRLSADLIAAVIRYDDLTAALAAHNITEAE